jgi:hypothetical protein
LSVRYNLRLKKTVEHPTVNLRKRGIRFIGTGLLKQATTIQTNDTPICREYSVSPCLISNKIILFLPN